MTNEQLVKQIQNGHIEFIEVLWKQVEAFINSQAMKRLSNLPPHMIDFREDMVQQSYIHFLKAIEGYAEGIASFLTYLTYHLANGFTEVVYGGRGKRNIEEPINSSISLDAPINAEDSETTLLELIIDTESGAYYTHIEDVSFWEDVNRVLNLCIGEIKNDRSRRMLQLMLKYDIGQADARRLMGGSEAERSKYGQIYLVGMRELRKRLNAYMTRNNDSCIADYIPSYNGGLRSFLNTRTSCVEWAVMKKVDRDLKYADMLHSIRGPGE